VIPGRRASERAVTRLFNLVRLEKRDRAFATLDKAYRPVLNRLEALDESRDRLIKALEGSAHADLALMLRHKPLTLTPEPVDVVFGPPTMIEFKPGARQATAKVAVMLPNGEQKQVWAKIARDGITWRVMVPLADSAEGKPSGPSPKETLSAVDKAVGEIKEVLDELAGRLEGGEMIEEAAISERLTAAGRPLVAALQRMIYGQTTIE